MAEIFDHDMKRLEAWRGEVGEGRGGPKGGFLNLIYGRWAVEVLGEKLWLPANALTKLGVRLVQTAVTN